MCIRDRYIIVFFAVNIMLLFTILCVCISCMCFFFILKDVINFHVFYFLNTCNLPLSERWERETSPLLFFAQCFISASRERTCTMLSYDHKDEDNDRNENRYFRQCGEPTMVIKSLSPDDKEV